jgi:hypothetical protein
MTRCRDRVAAAAVIVVATIAGAGAGRARADDAADASRVARLAAHYYQRAQYYRAIGAYEELALFAADDATRRFALARIAMAYQRGDQLEDAIAAYDVALAAPGVDDTLGGWLRIQRAVARGDLALARPLSLALDDVTAELEPLTRAPGAPYAMLARAELARLQLARGLRDDATRTLDAATRDCATRPVDDCAVVERVARAARGDGPRHRSPLLGLALSAVVPGLGAIYSEHYVDAIYYAGLTGAAALGAWDVYDPGRSAGDQKTTFYALTTLAATFYLANVFQGYVAAERWNAVEAYHHEQHVLDATRFDLPLEQRPILPGPAL